MLTPNSRVMSQGHWVTLVGTDGEDGEVVATSIRYRASDADLNTAAERIAACVNACRGFPLDLLQSDGLKLLAVIDDPIGSATEVTRLAEPAIDPAALLPMSNRKLGKMVRPLIIRQLELVIAAAETHPTQHPTEETSKNGE